MPRYAWNKSALETKVRYYELIRQGLNGAQASKMVGVSLSCGSNWFIDAGSVTLIDKPISNRFFDQDDRIEIAEGLRRGESVKVIAARIGKTFQSVYREIARNSREDGSYHPWFAHGQAYKRRRRGRPCRFEVDTELAGEVGAKLEQRWSPQQVSRWLKRTWPKRGSWHVCHETIYEAVYRGHIDVHAAQVLRTGRSYRHRRGRGRNRQGALRQLTNLRSIHQRSPGVETRRIIGHWEGDLIIGSNQRSAMATLVERKTRYTVLVRLPGSHTAKEVGDALIERLESMPAGLRRSLTWDQGNEMFHHERVERVTGTKIYFADAHSPWQRGTNENTNGLLRQYFPKRTDLRCFSLTELERVAAELNNRPRLCLADRSPNELMQQWLQRQSFATISRN